MPTDVKKLEKLVKYHQDLYYNNEPEIDDVTFDALVAQLRKLDPKNKLLGKVGQDRSDGFEKAKHLMKMTSQQKAANPEELAKWHKKGLHEDQPLVVNHKLDGMSLELQYQDGKFTKGVTRGDGDVGDDITKNVKQMQGFTAKIPGFSGAVRGEIVMMATVWKSKYAGEKNPRTKAVGIAKTPKGGAYGDVTIVTYDVYTPDLQTEEDKLVFLREHFDFVAETRICKSLKQIVKWYEEIIATRDDLEVAIDGLVIKCNKVVQKDLERTEPTRQIALKFPSPEKVTVLLGVHWKISGTTYSPVADIKAVNIMGSTVVKASLHNPGIMAKLGLRIGSKVTVSKRKDIIPKIENVVEMGDGPEIEIPTECVNCGSELKYTETKLFCPNPDCVNKLHHQIKKWIETLDVKEFGKGLIQMIFDGGLVTNLADLYKLDISDISELTGDGGKKLGVKNATKAIENLHAMTEVPLYKFVAGFDIAGIGEKNIQTLMAAGYDTLDKLVSFCDGGETVKGIGEAKTDALRTGLEKHAKDMKKLGKHIKITHVTVTAAAKDAVSVCFTGTLSMKRKEAADLVTKKGGVVKTTVTKGVTYLVTPDPNSSTTKNEQAKKLGTTVISEERFKELFS